MRTSNKILSTLLTAAFVSGALAGNAFAIDPDDTRGDARAKKPLHILPFQGDWNGTAKAGFPHK